MAYETTPQLKQQSALGVGLSVLPEQKEPFRKIWKHHKILYFLLIPAILYLIFMRIYPFWGIGLAFVDFSPVKGLSGSEFVGLKHFQEVFRRPEILNLIRNTLIISLGKIFLGEITGLAFALLLNEVKFPPYRRLAQTVTTIPHFFSWIIVGAIIISLMGSKGIVNQAIFSLGLEKIRFIGDKAIFPFTLIFSDTWKEFGWSAVIYLAALTQISPEWLEAAAVDGAGRIARLWYIILPSILPIFIFMIALGMGSVLDAGFDQVVVLYNPAVYSTGDILDTYIYRVGMINFKYEIATVVGVIKALVGYAAIMAANWASGKIAHYRIF